MLDEVLALFMQRYGLKEPDDSVGCKAIQGAIAGSVSISEVRRVLTADYELYPQYEGRVLEILNQLETVAGSVAFSPDSATESATGTGTPVAKPRTRGGKKTT